eukprot:scaffold6294_cov107-Isochrysis_galbana.AAC.1
MHRKRVNVKRRRASSAVNVNTLQWLARGSPPISRKSAAFEGQKGGNDAPSLFFPDGNTRLKFYCRREPSLADPPRRYPP